MYGRGYFDIEAILAEEERVVTYNRFEAVECGFIDPSCLSEHLPEASKIELPMWLTKHLERKDLVVVEIPPIFGHKFRRHLLADPSSVNLKEQSPFYFEMGLDVIDMLDEEEASELSSSLRYAFSGSRFGKLLGLCLNSRTEQASAFTRQYSNEDLSLFTQQLTNMEKKLFEAGYFAANDVLKWKNRQKEMLECASILRHAPKRRRVMAAG